MYFSVSKYLWLYPLTIFVIYILLIYVFSSDTHFWALLFICLYRNKRKFVFSLFNIFPGNKTKSSRKIAFSQLPKCKLIFYLENQHLKSHFFLSRFKYRLLAPVWIIQLLQPSSKAIIQFFSYYFTHGMLLQFKKISTGSEIKINKRVKFIIK